MEKLTPHISLIVLVVPRALSYNARAISHGASAAEGMKVIGHAGKNERDVGSVQYALCFSPFQIIAHVSLLRQLVSYSTDETGHWKSFLSTCFLDICPLACKGEGRWVLNLLLDLVGCEKYQIGKLKQEPKLLSNEFQGLNRYKLINNLHNLNSK